MLLVPCPWCGPREEIEFLYGGQAGIAYPADASSASRRCMSRHRRGNAGPLVCDANFVSGGWNPDLTLWRSIGGGVRYDDGTACFLPNGDGPPWLSVVGRAIHGVAATPYPFVPAEDTSRHFVDLQRDQTVADIAGALDAGLRSVEHIKRATYIGTAVDQGRTSGVLTAAIVNAMLGEDPGAHPRTPARDPGPGTPPWRGPDGLRPAA